jgi:hypothetical protein
MRKTRKPKALEIILIMVAFGIAAIANSLSRPTVENEVTNLIAEARESVAAMVAVRDLP